jgi:hypothetical protein
MNGQPPQMRYAGSGKINIAYQVTGDGPLDLVYVPGWVSHVELAWEDRRTRRSCVASLRSRA